MTCTKTSKINHVKQIQIQIKNAKEPPPPQPPLLLQKCTKIKKFKKNISRGSGKIVIKNNNYLKILIKIQCNTNNHKIITARQ